MKTKQTAPIARTSTNDSNGTTRWVKSKTLSQLLDICESMNIPAPIGKSKAEVATAIAAGKVLAAREVHRTLTESAVAMANRRRALKEKYAEAVKLGVQVREDEKRTGLYQFTTEIEIWTRKGVDPMDVLFLQIAEWAESWDKLVVDVLKSLLNETPLRRELYTPVLDRPVRVSEEWDEVQEEMEKPRRRTAGRKRHEEPVTHRKPRVERAERIVEPVHEEPVADLIEESRVDLVTNPGRW